MREGVNVEVLARRGEGRLPGLIGFTMVSVSDGELVARLDIRHEILAPNGYLHAASIIALADTACGYGCLAHLPDGATNFTTVELKCNFIGTAREGGLRCVAKPAHLGRTTQVWDATVTREADDATIALFRCTQMVLWPR